MPHFLSISIVSCTYNFNSSIFKESLESIKLQKYPKNLIEHIVMDGGSKDGTIQLAKSYGCLVITRPDLQNCPQVRMNLGIGYARNKLILILEPDNILVGDDWFLKMIEPFLKKKNVFCSFSMYGGYKKTLPLLTRYCALFGTSDPVLYYLRKTEKIRRDEKKYNKGELVMETDNFLVVKFTKDNLPTLGDNGQMFLKSAFEKISKKPEFFTHTDAVSEMLEAGYDTFGVVKNEVIHVTHAKISAFVKQRVKIKEEWTNKKGQWRKYHVFNWRSKTDLFHMVQYILYSSTIILPLLSSLKGFLKIHDYAWFLHPILCLLMLVGYGYSEVKFFVKRGREYVIQ